MSKHYLCGVDFQHEMDEGLADVYTSIADLKAAKPCWKECGIVEIELDAAGNLVNHEWLIEQRLF